MHCLFAQYHLKLSIWNTTLPSVSWCIFRLDPFVQGTPVSWVPYHAKWLGGKNVSVLTYYYVTLNVKPVPSVLWRCWLGGRKGIRPVKNWVPEVLAWLSVWSEVQTCIWPSWCHCHSLSLASVKSRLVLPFWYRPTWVVPEKGPLNVCVCVCVNLKTLLAPFKFDNQPDLSYLPQFS